MSVKQFFNAHTIDGLQVPCCQPAIVFSVYGDQMQGVLPDHVKPGNP
ncbi:MAG: hypothetical protein ACOCWZ_03030 [Spirochaetota bacterium]